MRDMCAGFGHCVGSQVLEMQRALEAGMAELKRNSLDERNRLARESARLEALQQSSSAERRISFFFRFLFRERWRTPTAPSGQGRIPMGAASENLLG